MSQDREPDESAAARPSGSERAQEVVPPAEGAAPQDLDVHAAIEAAEMAAEEIRRDAEERAAAHLRAAHAKADRLTAERIRSIATVTDELIAQAGSIRSRSDELIAVLRQATETLTRALGQPAPSPPPTAISATGVHEDAPLPTGHPQTGADGAEFRARQLADAGASPRTIAIVLRREFNVEPMPILERVLN